MFHGSFPWNPEMQPGLGFRLQIFSFKASMMQNQIDKKFEHEMETGIIWVI